MWPTTNRNAETKSGLDAQAFGVGSAVDGTVRAFIPATSTERGRADAAGNIYAASSRAAP